MLLAVMILLARAPAVSPAVQNPLHTGPPPPKYAPVQTQFTKVKFDTAGSTADGGGGGGGGGGGRAGSNSEKYHPYGGSHLRTALREIVDPIIANGKGQQREGYTPVHEVAEERSFYRQADGGAAMSSPDITLRGALRRRCSNYLACEHHLPVVEIQNAVFYRGALYLNNPDAETLNAVREMSMFYASVPNRLPAQLTSSTSEALPWMPGPEVILYNTQDADYQPPTGFRGPPGGYFNAPKKCTRIWDTNAFFLFPWEVENAYHSLNDNLLSVLVSVILQHITDVTHGRGWSPSQFKTLFMFSLTTQSTKPRATKIMAFLRHMFNGDVQSPFELFDSEYGQAENNVYCIRRMAWGTAMKPLGIDGTTKLMRLAHAVLRRVNQLEFGGVNVPSKRNIDTYSDDARKKKLKVVLITRNRSGADGSGRRSIEKKSEMKLLTAFDASEHVEARRCCDWGSMKGAKEVAVMFANADVCISVHGAGLANCVFGPPRMVVFEMQAPSQEYFGFDPFIKLAHMAGGGSYGVYIPEKLTPSGIVLNNDSISDIVFTSLGLARRTLKASNKNGAVASYNDFIIDHATTYHSQIIIILSPVAADMQSWVPLSVLGPLGAPQAPYGAKLIPFHSNKQIHSSSQLKRMLFFALFFVP